MDNQQNTIVSAKAIIQLPDKDGSVLLGRRNGMSKFHPQGWECLGGKVEVGEDPNKALLREIFEESGWNVEEAEITPLRGAPFMNEFYDKGKSILHEVHFSIVKLGQIMLANPRVMLSDAHIESRFVKPKEVRNYNLPVTHSKAFKFAFESGLL